MTRNLITDEIAQEAREGGGYTFNAFPPDDYEGFVLVIACVRLGDHAHLEVDSGRQCPKPPNAWKPYIRRSAAGRLIFPWHEWLILRAAFDAIPWVRIAEVEQPTAGQAARYAG